MSQEFPKVPAVSMRDLRVLVIEDEALVAMYLETLLEELGCRCVGTASSGEAALGLAETIGCDLALVDIRLQGSLDGVDTALRLRERFQIPSIFMTGGTESGETQRAVNALGFISKPYTIADLEAALAAALPRLRGRSDAPLKIEP